MLNFTLSICATSAVAVPPTLDPSIAGQGTTLLVALDQSALTTSGTPADSITVALERGMRFDSAAVEQLCPRSAAARSACSPSSRIGFGRFVAAVRGYDFAGGEANLAWSIDAYLGEPLRRADAASVVLTANLLGASSVSALLTPLLGASVPTRVTTIGRLVQRRSGRYSLEVSFQSLPVHIDVAKPITVRPIGLDLALGAVRHVREDFVHRVKVRAPSGYEIRKIRDHRLIGHNLVQTPSQCKDSWSVQLRVGFAGRVKRTTSRIACSMPGAGTASGRRPDRP